MNKMLLIGNLTRDPQLRTVQTKNGLTPVCSFGVAVNRRAANSQDAADYFNVTVWGKLGEVCTKYLLKGSKVCVTGPISVRTYQASDGTTRAAMEVMADDVEFLTKLGDAAEPQKASTEQLTPVEDDADLPF